MKQKTRLSFEARRDSIIAAARTIFAEKGFHGTTTRELAGAADVSEALLFKHFPNKAAIYEAMLDECHKTEISAGYQKLLALEPSTSTLTVMLHFLFTKLLSSDETNDFHRLLLRSLSEDGEFARVFLDHIGSTFVPKLRECLAAAEKAGDLRANCAYLKSGAWLTQHLVLMLGFMHISDKPIVNYKVGKEKFAEDAVVFCLTGLGLRDEAVARFYNPKALALLSPN